MLKSNQTNILIALPLLAVVLVSGCTGPGPASGPGVIITGWEPDLSTVFSDEKVDFLIEVQNQGGSRARNVIAELTNIDLNEWGGFGQQQLQLGNLIPSDLASQTPGETQSRQFTNLRSPTLNKGTSFAYEPTVRVSYDYTTTAQKPITIVDRTELVRIQQQGQSLPSQATTYTSGPLMVDILMGNYVKTSGRFGLSGRSYDIFPVQITITNNQWGAGGSVTAKGFQGLGGGFSGFGEFDYPILVKVKPPTGTSFVFSGFGDQDCSQFQFTVDLFKGREVKITCELEVTSPPTIKSQSLIQVDLDYRFFIDRITSVTVHGTREIGGF